MELKVHLGLGPPDDGPHGDENEVEGHAAVDSVAAKTLAEKALRPVPSDCRSDFSAYRQPKPMATVMVLRGHQPEERPVETMSLFQHAPELGWSVEALAWPEPRSGPQTASRFRPFWRRRLSTSRPPLVRMRTRNPWVRFLFRLLGWNVLFISILYGAPVGPPGHRGS